MRTDRQFRADLAAGEDLHGVGAGRKALGLQRVRSDLVARLETLLEIGKIHGLGLGAEVLEGHRLVHVRTAKLSHPHVNRRLTALVAGLSLGARARARALVATAGGLAVAAALAATDALATVGRARLRLQVVEADLFGTLFVSHHSLTSTRWETTRICPCSCGESSRSTDLPIRPRPRALSVAFCFGFVPFGDLTWDIFTAIRRVSHPRAPRQRPEQQPQPEQPGPRRQPRRPLRRVAQKGRPRPQLARTRM